MAANRIQIKFDIDNKDLDILAGKTLTLQQQIRILKQEIQKPGYAPAELDLLRKKLGDTEDALKSTRARSGDFLTSLQLMPGPIGEITSKLNGTISLFKQFGSFSFADLKFQFKETLDDIKEVGAAIGRTTGITAAFEKTSSLLEAGFKRVGMSADAAAKAARGWGMALTAVGIGAIIFGIYKLVEAYNSLSAEQKLTNELAEQSAQIAGKQISTLTQLEALLKQTTLTDRQKDEAVKQYNTTLGDTLGKVENWIELEGKLIGKLPEYKAYLLKRAEAEATAMLITKAISDKIQTEMTDPASMAGFFDVWSEGGILGFFIEGRKGTGENIQKRALSRADKTIMALQERLMKTNEEIAQQQKQLGLQAPPPEPPKTTKKTTEKTPEQIAAEKLAQQKEALNAQIKAEVDAENTRESVLRPLIEKRDALDIAEIDKQKQIADKQFKDKKISQEEYTNLLLGFEAKKKIIAEQSTKEIENALEADKAVNENRIKTEEDFNRRIRDLKTSAIVDDVERAKQQRMDKFEDELAALEKDKEFIKKSEEEKAQIRKNLRTILENDLEKITTDANQKTKEDELKAFDERLRLLELEGQSLIEGTRAYYDNKLAILKTAEAKELAQLKIDYEQKKLTKEEYEKAETDLAKKYAKSRKDIKQQELAAVGRMVSASIDALGGLTNALAGALEEEAKTSKEAFEKRKKLQIATAVMSAASGLVQILTQPSTIPSPGDWIVKGVNAAALAISTATNIKKIKATQFEGGGEAGTGVVAMRAQGGIVTGPGTSTSDSIPAMISNGEYVVNARATSAFLPMLNAINDYGRRPRFAMGGLVQPQSPQSMFTENLNRAIETTMTRPVRTYVVGQEMSNQQQLDRVIKSRSLM